MSSPLNPTAEQLAAARLAQWHQSGEALLTFENLRSWINVAGLVLFTPRAGQLPAPAPSLVEAALGAANTEPGLAEVQQAKGLLARLVAEGIAVPLNLLGTPGETPDFVATAAVFSYIFTLRGDKAWKQSPATSGAVKVSPLAAATHEALSKSGPLSAYDLATALGKEVTESAVLRALNELWAHLRVIPIAQPDGAATRWELTSARFTKHIKAGANAGQPSALSALISLYLGSAMLATEEEIETFLSPLAARSRIRDVIHALMGARELETLVVEGKTLLHISGSLPAFAAPAVLDEGGDVQATPVETIEVEAGGVIQETDAPRIKKFVAKPRKLGTGFPSDYGRKFSGVPLDPRDRKSDSERRPFDRSAKPGRSTGAGKPMFKKTAFDKPAFNKPWDEERKPRPEGGEGRPAFEAKPAFRPKPGLGRKPAFETRPSTRSSFQSDGARPSRREFKPGADAGENGDDRGPRKTFSKPGTFGRRREGFGGKAVFGDSRPPRREFSGRGSESRDLNADRPARSFDRPKRAASDRPPGGLAPRTPGSFSPRPRSGFGGKPAIGGKPVFGGKPGFSRDRESSGGDGASRPVYRKFDAPRGERPARPYSSERSEGGSGRPSRSFNNAGAGGDKKPYGKSAGGGFGAKRPTGGTAKPSGTFAKFADGKNPFRKPGKPGGKGGSFKGKATDFSGKPAYRERKPKAGE